MGMVAILVIWTLTFVTPLNLRSLHMKFEINSPSGFWENFVLIYWWDSNISYIGWKVEGLLWPLELNL